MTQYVQHISGQGLLWELTNEGGTGNDEMEYPCWIVKSKLSGQMIFYNLPKSEYRLYEPSERWVDVTAECMACNQGVISVMLKNEHTALTGRRGYRLRKVQITLTHVVDPVNFPGKWAFIVEQKESA